MPSTNSIARQSDEQSLLEAMKRDSHEAFSTLFHAYYKDLVLFGGSYIADQAVCEDIVQNVFLNLWKNRQSISIHTSLKSYLLKSTQNYCLDELRHRQIIEEHIDYELEHGTTDCDELEEYILYSDLYEHLQGALAQLDSLDRKVFEMSRMKNIRYQEIADKLNISVRTVEVHISKALKQLRILLKDYYLPVLLFFWF